MNSLQQILSRNIGNVLTPELVWGIYNGFVESVPDTLCITLPVIPAPPITCVSDPRLVIDDRDRVGGWVADNLGIYGGWGGFAAIGLLDKPCGELVAGVILTEITKTNAYIHIASSGKHRLKTLLFYAVADYAFRQLKLERVTGMIDVGNLESLRFAQHIGFEYEHTVKHGNGDDVIMLVMWRDKCRWINRQDKTQ